MKTTVPVIPVPNMVFYPNTSLPLFVEDPNYINLIEDAVRKGNPIGISLAQPVMTFDNSSVQRVQFRPCHICGIGVPTILEKYSDGSLKVLVQGTGKVKLGKVVQELPYPIFDAETLSDHFEDADFPTGTISSLTDMLDDWIKINVRDSLEREAFQRSLTSLFHVLDYICMLMISDREVRQLLLETTSPVERLHMINTLLKTREPLREDREAAQAIKYYEIIEKVSDQTH